MKTKLIALSIFSAALATSTIASAQMQRDASNKNVGWPYHDSAKVIGANLIGGIHDVIRARVTELEISYKQNGDYDVIKYKLDKSSAGATSKKNIKKAVKHHVAKKDEHVGWQQCISQPVKGYDAGLFCIHSNNDNIVGYAFKEGEIRNVPASKPTTQTLLANKRKHGESSQ